MENRETLLMQRLLNSTYCMCPGPMRFDSMIPKNVPKTVIATV